MCLNFAWRGYDFLHTHWHKVYGEVFLINDMRLLFAGFLFLGYQQHTVDNVIEAAKAICSVLCFVETRDIADAVTKLRAVPLVKAQVKEAS